MKKVIIYTHNPIRDPITDDCLTVALRNMGHHVWRRNYLDCDKNMVVYIKPDIIIMPEIRCEYSRDFAKQCKDWGVQVVVRPCEVGISEESIPAISDDYRRAIFGENWPVGDMVDLFLAWGPKMKDLFVKYGGIQEEKVAVVGGLAFDQFFLPEPPDKVERTEKKRVMFATGFAYADRNPQYSVPEALHGDPIHREMVETDQRGRSKWFDLIKRFHAERGDTWEIWVKLHPGEKEEVYRAILKDAVEICPALPPVRALKYVDCIVHAGSTMAYEAHLKDMPAINLKNVCQDVVVSKISPNVDTFEELVDGIDTLDLTRSNADPNIIAQLERDYYGTTDGKASERAAQAIDLLPESETSVPDEWPASHEMKYMSPGVLKNVEQWTCRGCNHAYSVQGPREMIKCPFCGIANVKMAAPQPQPGG
jgi:surface carbohydrate biosynthesis protein